MTLLGIDPGLGTTGFGIISLVNKKIVLIDYGIIKTSTKDQLSDRLKIIFNKVTNLIKKYEPTIFSIEEVFYSNNAKSSLLLGHARSAAMVSAAIADIMIYEYSAKKIKQSLTGNGNAHKEQVKFMVKSILGIEESIKSDDASDALAIAICHCHQIGHYN